MPGDPNHYAQLLLALVPENVRKSISEPELLDRVAESQRLSARAADHTLTPAQRREARERAQQVMRAAPRAAVEKEVAEKILKAQQLGDGSQAAALRRHAQRLLEENPPAPRRGAPVRKAAKAPDLDITPVWNEHGQLIGIVDTDQITPIGGGAKPADPQQAAAAAPAGAPAAGQPVAKSSAYVTVWDQHGHRLVVRRTAIRKTADPRPLRPGEDPLAPLPPAVQALNRGPVRAGGTTGLGLPRTTGPASALPGDGPQQALPGDIEGRAIVKALGGDWRMARDSRGRLTGAVRQRDIRPAKPGAVLKGASARAWTPVCNSAGQQVGVAPLASVIALADLRAAGRVAKALGR